MKTIKSFIVIVLIISPILSCEELDELLVKDIDVPISFVIDINNLSVPDDPNEDADNSFNEGSNFNVRSNPDVANVISKPEQIKKVILNSVKYEYRNFSGNVDAIVTGAIEFFISGSTVSETFVTERINVAQASLTTETFNLDDAQGVKMPLDNSGTVYVIYRGYSSENPIQFDTRLIVNATVTVEVNPYDL